MAYRWVIRKPQYPPESLIQRFQLPAPFARVLSARGLPPQEIERLLWGSLEDLHSPFALQGMEAAVTRIIEALQNGETILIHGDYDVDGITALALLYRNLRALGAKHLIPYIPDRFEEGYGVSEKGIRKALDLGATLMITVDCGITARTQTRWAQSQGIDVIITDHHEPPPDLPEALAVINPKLGGYPFQELAGVGVAFKLLEALYEYTGQDRKRLLWDLDLVALGTVADVVPLLDENRILVKYGLKVLEKTLKAGLRALKHVARLNGRILPWHISFILAPRLNAAGRLSHAQKAFHLLITTDGAEALGIAEELDRENRKRQAIEQKIFEDAVGMIERELDLDEFWAVVLASDTWHEGVIGIVASKLVERYHRPTVLISVGEEYGKGSARSIEGFHLFQAFQEVEEHLLAYGGHAFAAGMKISPERIEAFRRALNEVAKRKLREEDLVPVLQIDASLELEEITEELRKAWEALEPFGMGNPKPMFLLKGLQVVGTPRLLKEKHVRFAVRKGQVYLPAIAFRKPHLMKVLEPQGMVDLVAVPSWDAQGRPELRVLDARKGEQSS